VKAAPDELRQHAAHLDGVAGELSRARIAGADTGMTPNAYGHLCAIVPILLEQVRSPLTEAIGVAAQAAAENAGAIRRAADGYQQTDETAADELREAAGDGLRGGLR
jgi:hypothetical protein